ncbi:MAG TPA: guanylate kinase [Turneriella sp.]|nr:guanylate kinase [Turneriella sp.]HMY11974.1 guanylate kinase [Turneriella sp.]HNE18404.1 guanylate kinase [Turneriella sp.]HNJ66711.1 guanylate kinase [Turneriella sp.]HNL10756.1 guanylate kinase [Turneriella sp.]
MDSRPIFVISAPSGAGKNSLINVLLSKEPRLMHSISSTTRARRANEADGINYHFLSREEFEKRVEGGEFLEYARVLENYYGTEIREIRRIFAQDKYPILDIDVQGAQTLRGKPVRMVSIFIIPPSMTELERRLRARASETEEQIRSRLELARLEVMEQNNFDYVVVNDDLMKAAEELATIVRKHMV